MPPHKKQTHTQPVGSFGEYQYSERILQLLENSEESKIRGEFLQAISWAEKALMELPDCTGALEEIADNYLSLGKIPQAEKAAKYALELNKKSVTALYTIGFIESQRGNFETSITYLRRANDLRENNPEILRCLGWALCQAGKNSQGILILERSLNIQPNDSMILCDLGMCYLQVNQFQKSIKILEQAHSFSPESTRVLECLDMARKMWQISKSITS